MEKIIFLGTPNFSIPTLSKLIESKYSNRVLIIDEVGGETSSHPHRLIFTTQNVQDGQVLCHLVTLQ